ncbi:hypothetical protein [Dechloromonas sp.]|uniref:hypothetical protein n=1 Tax=Dechloromonas sp. TaxID=1917218 RepID=UPI00216BAAD4|nr:hypothetical protein [Dechloromonas sp.]MBU3697781.1 hypothetical protein [Dechloromonas sp.]
MANDRSEQLRRGQPTHKTTTKHPYAAIEHRVIDSPAFAALKPTAQALLLLLARQLTKDNNGHLQAAFKWCKRYGIGSEHTLRAAIGDLISHGFIYRTRSHGANGAWAKYAVTWLPIKNKEGLFLAGFTPFGWREWTPQEKKISPQKLLDQSGRKCSFNPETPAKSAGSTPVKTADYELMPCTAVVKRVYRPIWLVPTMQYRHKGAIQ